MSWKNPEPAVLNFGTGMVVTFGTILVVGFLVFLIWG